MGNYQLLLVDITERTENGERKNAIKRTQLQTLRRLEAAAHHRRRRRRVVIIVSPLPSPSERRLMVIDSVHWMDNNRPLCTSV